MALFVAMLWICVCSRAARAVDFDEADLAALSSHGLLRWDNVEGGPIWLGGAPLDRAVRRGLHVAQLKPGAYVQLHLPAGSMLRILSTGTPLHPQDLKIWVSNGSGLYRQLLSALAADGSMIAVPDPGRSAIIRVERPATTDCGVAVALFTARRVNIDDVFGYPCEAKGCGAPVSLAKEGRPDRRRYYRIRAGQTVELPVQGPARMRFQTRLAYPWHESRSHQAYQLTLSGSDGFEQALHMLTSFDSQGRTTLDGHPARLGREATAYWDVPLGVCAVRLECNADILLRVTSAPCRSGLPAGFEISEGWRDQGRSVWDLSYEDVMHQLASTTYPVGRRYRLAVRSARDNRYRDGGLFAWNIMRRVAVEHPAHPAISRWSQQFYAMNTTYARLVPMAGSGPLRFEDGVFSLPALVSPDAKRAPRVVPEGLIDEGIRLQPRGRFVVLPGKGELVYPLPPESTPSRLRIALDRQCGFVCKELRVQYDDEPPFCLKYCPFERLPVDRFEPTRAMASMAALHRRQPLSDAGTLGGPFAAESAVADLVDAASVEVNVPAAAKRIRIINVSDHVARIAVQRRQSRRYQMSESQLLESMARMNAAAVPLASYTATAEARDVQAAPDAWQETRNHYVPLLRSLENEYRAMVRVLEAQRPTSGLDSVSIQAIASTAQDHMRNERWLAALSLWSRLADVDYQNRSEAVMGRVTCLEKLDEQFLAETELRGRVVFDPDAEIRELAFHRLDEKYQSQDDNDARLRLAAASAWLDPQSDRLIRVAAGYARRGDWDLAVAAALAIDPADRPYEIVAQCAFHLRWWHLFESTLVELKMERRAYWEAHAFMHRGQHDVAAATFTRAGEQGQWWADHLQLGLTVGSGLRDADHAVRLGAMRLWEQWQSEHPGPYVWRRDTSVIREVARTETVRLIGTGEDYTAYRASVHEPARLVVQGPVKLRLEVRPLHPANSAQDAIEDWLHVRAGGKAYRWAILQNRPSRTLKIPTSPDAIPGSRESFTMRLGPGRHVLEVAAERTDVVLRTAIERPSEPLPVLPPLTEQTVRAVIDGRWGRTQIYPARDDRVTPSGHPSQVLVLSHDGHHGTWTGIPYVRQLGCHEYVDAGVQSVKSNLEQIHQQLRLAPTLTSEQALQLLDAARRGEPLTPAETLEVAARGRVRAVRPPSTDDPTVVQTQQAMALAADDIASAVQIDPGTDTATSQLHAALVLLQAKSHGSNVGLVPLADDGEGRLSRQIAIHRERIMSEGRWVLSREISSSAGVVWVASDDPAPHRRASAVRQAMAAPLPNLVADPDYLLSGYRRARVSVSDERPTHFEITLRQPKVSYLPMAPLEVELQINQRPPQSFRIDGQSRVVRGRLRLPAGDNEVMMRVKQPYLGQYVFVYLEELLPGNRRVPWSQRQPKSEKRLYHVATHDQPVVFRMTEPCWIRYEQRVGGTTELQEIAHGSGPRELVLSPPEGQQEALYRVWVFQPGAAMRPKPPRYTNEPVRQTPPPRWMDAALAASPIPQPITEPSFASVGYQPPIDDLDTAALASPSDGARFVDFADPFRLGGQEDGTWGLGLGFFHRRPLEEGTSSAGAADQFLQNLLSYSEFDEQRDRYLATSGVLRFREQSGPTFGVVHDRWYQASHALDHLLHGTHVHARHRHRWEKLRGRWYSFAYAQRPSDALPWHDEQTEGSVGAWHRWYYRADMTDHIYHMPSLRIGGRWLSLDRVSYRSGRVDQDIFTPFKSDHRVWMTITDRWIYEACPGHRLWLRPSLYTNEDLNPVRPDHISLQTGLSFLHGNISVDLAYRAARYFEDADRRVDSDQHLVYLDSLLHRWVHAGLMYEVDVSVNHDVGDGDTSAFLTLTRFTSQGRGYRDYHGSQVNFRELRERINFPRWR